MNAHRVKPLKFPWPSLLYGLAILGAVLLGRLHPIPVYQSHGWATVIAGSALILLAVCLNTWAIATVINRRLAVKRQKFPNHLIMCGPFRYTRNPVYLGHTIMTIGFGLITLNPWFFVLAILAVIVITAFAIRRQERHLLSRFGVEFEKYCRSTTRWI